MDSQNDINLPLNEDGETQLMQAAKAGDAEKVGSLIENGADINLATNKYHRTALMFAAENGHTETVILLVEKGANIHAVGTTLGNCPVNAHMLAFMSGNRETHICIDNYLLLEAAILGRNDDIKMHLDNGADINFANRSGLTALMCAVGVGNILTIYFLIQKGADISVAIKDTEVTARTIAELKGYSEICTLLDNAIAATNNTSTPLVFSNLKRKPTDDVEENENRPHKRARISDNDENVESKVDLNKPCCNIF